MTVIPKQRHIHWVDEICDMWLGQIPTYMHQFMWLGQIPTNMNPNHASLLNTLINHRSTTILHIFFTSSCMEFPDYVKSMKTLHQNNLLIPESLESLFENGSPVLQVHPDVVKFMKTLRWKSCWHRIVLNLCLKTGPLSCRFTQIKSKVFENTSLKNLLIQESLESLFENGNWGWVFQIHRKIIP